MTNSKSASVPLAAHFQLCKDQSPKTDSEKAKMEKIPYSNAIGSVMYLMVSTRPDIAYAGMWINYANDRGSRRSTTSYVFTLCGACISWKSQLQNIVALSTTEAEYIAITEAFKEALWLEGFFSLEPRSSFGCDDNQDPPLLDLVQGGDC
ncbi:Retrovirus-related Pol polyprotein from transposon TNT 1-94 [Sesamum angolense]|uniref:Retrovirus-related Pol polyprotein from transposon TNT 1-94 n=1 Tax=Sesamum angolense TaxID=2727404 RepID=A0AAE1T5P6_9LAMI|nr:Retrovirus-related Pol polyprotein from transposon TNT 1-94 [Sesamum angolense]